MTDPTQPTSAPTPAAEAPAGKSSAPPVSSSQSSSLAETPDDGREEYTITKLAGLKVAGRRVDGKTIRLTEAEARSELLSGAIVRKGEQLHAMFTRHDTRKKNA